MVGAVQGGFVIDWGEHWAVWAFFAGPPHSVGTMGRAELEPSATHWVEGALTWVDLVWGAWESFEGGQENSRGGQIEQVE